MTLCVSRTSPFSTRKCICNNYKNTRLNALTLQ